MSNVVLKLESVTYSYKMKTGNNVNVIRSASGAFETGKVYAIQSDKSGGKSTLLKLMAGLDDPDAGKISYKGTDLKEIKNEKYRAQSVGLALSELDLMPRYSVTDNMLLQMDIGSDEKSGDPMKKAVEIMDFINLDASARKSKTINLSEINKKKVRLARVMATFGDVILFDDMNADLSKVTTQEFFDLLKKVATERQICVIYTTESSLVASMADECYAINRGTMVKVK